MQVIRGSGDYASAWTPAITWQDDNTLRVDVDAGQQTRLLHFGAAKASGGPATWQGDSVGQLADSARSRDQRRSVPVRLLKDRHHAHPTRISAQERDPL